MADIYDGHDDQRTADLGPTAADRRPSTDSKKPQPIHRPYQKARDDRPKSEESSLSHHTGSVSLWCSCLRVVPVHRRPRELAEQE